MEKLKTLYWGNNKLYLLNQMLLPNKIEYVICKNSSEVATAIERMVIRGAPAIGIAVAFGLALGSIEKNFKSVDELKNYVLNVGNKLGNTRPTAVNLFWAIKRIANVVEKAAGNVVFVQERILQEAEKILQETINTDKKISEYGAKLLKKNSVVLTHCNAGGLATGGEGTAVGIIKEAAKQKKIKMVYVDETRPYLQGARLTTLELKQAKIPVTLITDNMAGYIIKTEKVSAVIVGADRITACGDVANKIGTYALAILAKYHGVKFYVAAPSSSIDIEIKSGSEIPIEERSPEEVVRVAGVKIAPPGIKVRHPAFDVTPAELVTAIITEKGVFRYPYRFN
ncbi:MAG: S-methyl-5-thioribose-1-phosphate isomerase [Elusimicrobiota bacterium]|nr:S-methyl-5-thioribose-1-phosphate isomerase [Elusimicrobiota bacterium]